MSKILYAVQGEGMGHATRSRAVIDELDHEVILAGSQKVNDYFCNCKKIKKKVVLDYLRISYSNNAVNTTGTFFVNLVRIPSFLWSFFKLGRIIIKEKPDLIISDFEIISSYLGLVFGLPLIAIDNVHVVSNYKVSVRKRDLWSYIKSRMAIKLIMPYASRYYVTNFFRPLLRCKKTEMFDPLIRDKIIGLKPVIGKHVLVYQTSSSSEELIPCLEKINEKFIVYGFGKRSSSGNVVFKGFNEKSFFDDLRKCKAVIMNGSYSLMTEALYLQKPVLAVPVKKQYEQMMNAQYLEKMGLGVSAKDYDVETIMGFLDKVEEFRSKMKRFQKTGNKKIADRINRAIKNIQK